MKTKDNVVPIAGRPQHPVDPELKSLQDAAKSLRWTLLVPLIGDSLGFGRQVVEAMADKDHQVPIDSAAALSGLATLGLFITTDQADGGLGLDWDHWSDSVLALIYRDRYSIHNSKANEILDAYKEVEAFLGRAPSDAIEFQRTKAKIVEEKGRAVTEFLKGEADSLRADNFSLSEGKKELESKVGSLNDKIGHLMDDLDEARSESDRLRGEIDQSILQAKCETEKRVHSELGIMHQAEILSLNSVISGLEDRLSKALSEAQSHREERDASVLELSELKARFKDLEVEHGELLVKFNELQEIIETARSDKESLESRIAVLESDLDAKRLLLNSNEPGASEPERSEITEEVEALEAQVNDLKRSLSHATASVESLQHMSERMKEYIVFLKNEKTEQSSLLEMRERQLSKALRTVAKLREQSRMPVENTSGLRFQMQLAFAVAFSAVSVAAYLILI